MGVSTYGRFNKLLKHVKAGSHYTVPLPIGGFHATFDGLNGIRFGYDDVKKTTTKVQYSLDNGAWLDVPSDGHIPSVVSGSRSLRLRGLNGIGQPGPETVSLAVVVNPPPLAVTNFAVSKVGYGVMGYTFTPAVGSTKTEYSLDGGAWTTTVLPQSLSDLGTGVHTLRLRGVNSAGVPGPETVPQMFRVYALPDLVAIVSATPITVNSAKLTLTLPATALSAEYSVDNGPWLPATVATTITGLSTGSHNVRVRGINPDGDRGSISGPVAVTLAPAPTQIDDLRINAQQISDFTVIYTYPSNTVSLQVSFDGGPWTAWDRSGFVGIAIGDHTVQLRGVNVDGFPGPASNLLAVNLPTPVSPVTNFAVVSKASRSFVVSYTKPAEATGVQYSTNFGPWTNMPSNNTISVFDVGEHRVQLRSVLPNGKFGSPTNYYMVTLTAVWVYSGFSQYWANANEFAKAGATFGYGVAMSGDGSVAAASAVGEGAFYVFNTATPSAPSRTARVTAPETVLSFGRMLSMSADGKTIAVGTASSRVYIYTFTSNTWTLLQTLTGPNGSDFGLYSMSMSDDGSVLYVPSTGGSATFKKIGGTYVRNGTLPLAMPNGSPQVLNSDGTLAVMVGGDSFSLEVWAYANAKWSQSATVPAGLYLSNVTMSSDGLYIAGTTIDMVSTRVFSRPNNTSTAWNQQAALGRYTAVTSTGNGSSISITADGSALLVSSDYSQFNTNNGIYGYAAFYARSGTTWAFGTEGNEMGRYGYHSQIARQGGRFVIGADTSTIGGFNNAGRMAVGIAGML